MDGSCDSDAVRTPRIESASRKRASRTRKMAALAASDIDPNSDALGPGNPDPIVGQYTGAGRFVVQRRFERPVVFTALDADETGLTARITATAIGETGEHHYEFVVDPES